MKQIIKQELKKLQDTKYKEFHSSLCPGVNNIIGVRVPVLRSYAKELIKQYDIKELLKNIDDEYYEEIMLQGMLIGLSKENIESVIEHIESFIPKINNWAVCDTFCAGLKVTKKNKEKMWNFIIKYLNSDKEFEVRFSIVMILDYYIEQEKLQKVFEIFDSIKSDKYYVQMAVAWAISICLIKYYDETLEYLKNTDIDIFIYNKALQKAIESYRINNEQKTLLRSMKK